jgi:hypothetical protein
MHKVGGASYLGVFFLVLAGSVLQLPPDISDLQPVRSEDCLRVAARRADAQRTQRTPMSEGLPPCVSTCGRGEPAECCVGSAGWGYLRMYAYIFAMSNCTAWIVRPCPHNRHSKYSAAQYQTGLQTYRGTSGAHGHLGRLDPHARDPEVVLLKVPIRIPRLAGPRASVLVVEAHPLAVAQHLRSYLSLALALVLALARGSADAEAVDVSDGCALQEDVVAVFEGNPAGVRGLQRTALC